MAMWIVIPVFEFFILIWMNGEALLALFTQTREKRLGIDRTRGSWDVLPLLPSPGATRGAGLGAAPRASCRLDSALGARAAPGSAVPRPPRPVPGSYKGHPSLPSLGVRRAQRPAVQRMALNTNLRVRLPVICLVLQVVMVVLFGVFVRYDVQADARWWLEKKLKNISSDIENDFYYRYSSKSYGRQSHL